MLYHNYNDSACSAYNKEEHFFSDLHLQPKPLAEFLDSDEWKEAIHDPQGCTIVLPIEFVRRFDLFSRFWEQLVETERLSEICYIKNVDVTDEQLEEMSNEDKAFQCKDCVRIQLSSTPTYSISMRINEEEDIRDIPYVDIKENNVLAPERYPSYPSTTPLSSDGKQGDISQHVSIIEYKGNAPDVLVMPGDLLLGIDDLRPILGHNECPQLALKIDLKYWFPEYLRAALLLFHDAIIYGTTPGVAGVEQRLKRIMMLDILPPSLSKQMELMEIKDISLESCLSNSTLMPECLPMIAATLGTAGALATTSGLMGTITGAGALLGGLSTLCAPLALAGLGIWGASKLLTRSHQYHVIETPECSQEEDAAQNENHILEEDYIQREEALRKQEIEHLHNGHIPEEEREREEKRLQGMWQHQDEEKLREREEEEDYDIIRRKRVLYRRKVDAVVTIVMRQGKSGAPEKLSELSSILAARPDFLNDGDTWLHKIDFIETQNPIRIVEIILKLKSLLSGDCSEELKKVCPECEAVLKSNFADGVGFIPNICNTLLDILNDDKDKYEASFRIFSKGREKELEIRAEERQNVLYEMSHHIKNLVVSVIDPLENLAGNMPPEDKFVLETAIKGASMIRQIVFFITNSYRFTVEDFLYDLSNPVETPQSLGNLFENTLRASVASMFDKQTHDKYMRLYYPTRESFMAAKNNWYEAKTLADVFAFMGKHMNIEVSVDLHSFERIILGNKKGSATNMAILFNELTMNMLKALAIVPANERSFFITTKEEGEYLCLFFKNACRNSKTVSKGYGKTIVANIVKGFGGTLTYNEDERFFEVMTQIPFFKQSPTTTNEVNK